VAEKMGFATPEMLDELPEEEQEDKKAEILEEATRRCSATSCARRLLGRSTACACAGKRTASGRKRPGRRRYN